jgi:hypothetical protein
MHFVKCVSVMMHFTKCMVDRFLASQGYSQVLSSDYRIEELVPHFRGYLTSVAVCAVRSARILVQRGDGVL